MIHRIYQNIVGHDDNVILYFLLSFAEAIMTPTQRLPLTKT